MSIKRFAEDYLVEWKDRSSRKPLILRGARQTGKTYLVEQFAKNHFRNLLKIDFEFDQEVKSVFRQKDPQTIISELSLFFDLPVIPGETLLFLDEIQACPEAIHSLRYFYEKLSGLHVIAAGSLLDFVLRDFEYSMPVGRVEFLHLYPLSFSEFLLAVNARLHEFITNWTPPDQFSPVVHGKLTELMRTFIFTGGMPEAVASWIKQRDYVEVQRIQSAILSTMQHDFAKYGSRIQQDHLQKILQFIPGNIGNKVKYVHVDRDVRSTALKDAFHLLAMARVISLVFKTNANGVPLEAEKDRNFFKAIALDVGLVNRMCGLKLIRPEELMTVYEGRLAEQFVGQELLGSRPCFEEPALYYWAREAKNANAEVDYLFTHGSQVLPVEVKAGKTGTLRSLHVFLHEKKSDFGVRLNMDTPSLGRFTAHVRLKKSSTEHEYTLLSLPLYLAGQLDRLLEHALDQPQ
ncbi:ATP-binding protein [Desulfonatronovibrio magnus]|uniref:ATP-binding protein n=1 Tax=Desulfonatronovibrio magnus TaxID=698827 RepID=UPI000697D29F|nr:AAA family ATPase [Desulfonatronovibrio magnus]